MRSTSCWFYSRVLEYVLEYPAWPSIRTYTKGSCFLVPLLAKLTCLVSFRSVLRSRFASKDHPVWPRSRPRPHSFPCMPLPRRVAAALVPAHVPKSACLLACLLPCAPRFGASKMEGNLEVRCERNSCAMAVNCVPRVGNLSDGTCHSLPPSTAKVTSTGILSQTVVRRCYC